MSNSQKIFVNAGQDQYSSKDIDDHISADLQSSQHQHHNDSSSLRLNDDIIKEATIEDDEACDTHSSAHRAAAI